MSEGFWIDAKVWNIETLSNNEKLLLSRIQSLDQNGSCFASNKYFAHFLNISEKRVGELLKKLEEKGFIYRSVENGRRKIYPKIRDTEISVPKNREGDTQKIATPPPKTREYNKKYSKNFNKKNISSNFNDSNSKKNRNENSKKYEQGF